MFMCFFLLPHSTKALKGDALLHHAVDHWVHLRCLQIVSGSRDKTIKLWNTLGECKYTIGDPDGHSEWVSCVRFSPVTANPMIVSAGWDKLVKVWNLTNCRLRHNLAGHSGYINTVTVSPDGSLCASGGKVGSPPPRFPPCLPVFPSSFLCFWSLFPLSLALTLCFFLVSCLVIAYPERHSLDGATRFCPLRIGPLKLPGFLFLLEAPPPPSPPSPPSPSPP